MQAMIAVGLFSLLCIYLHVYQVNSIPVEDFYTFNADTQEEQIITLRNGDECAANDCNDGTCDGPCAKVSLTQTTAFYVYNQPQFFLIVSVNGGITLCGALPIGSTCNPIPFTTEEFPLNDSEGRALIAPFWADVDTTNHTGEVSFYQNGIQTDPSEFSSIDEMIAQAFPFQPTFNTTSFLIVTWDQVGYYNDTNGKTNTFQLVLATDSVNRSFAIYLYADDMIEWTTGGRDGGVGGLGGTPAQVGINEGNGVDFSVVPGSRTDDIINIVNSSNTDTSGVYVIRISDGVIPMPCMLNGVEYKFEEEVQVNCTTRCMCASSGDFDCITMNCTYDGPTCTVSSDPHYRTYDGLWYDFHGTCEYVLTQLCDGNDDYVISARNSNCGRGVSCVNLVRVRIPGENFEIVMARGRGNLFINGTRFPGSRLNDPTAILYQSNTVDVFRIGGLPHVFLKTYGLRIFWDSQFRVEVTTSTLNVGQICGLCGAYNNDSSDDFQQPDGTLASSEDEFGDSWLVPDPSTTGCSGGNIKKRNLPSRVVQCPCDPNITAEAQTRCNFLRQQPFTPCNIVVDPSVFIANCEFDYCCCNETEREDCYCDALSSYASACADAGVSRSIWRSHDLCPFSCSAGMIYQQCGPLCPQTCNNLDQLCEGGCAEGCFCPVGQVLIDGVCLDTSRCTACVLNDVIYHQGEEIQPNCSTRCVCLKREFVCEAVPCAADGATCVVSGYSHYQTFDYQFFEFQGDCEYILTTPCDSNEFIITIQNTAHSTYVSGVDQVNITIPSESISIILGRGDMISINDALQPISDIGVVMSSSVVQVLRVGGKIYVILLVQNVTIFWDGLYRVEVTVSTTWQNRLCGLCGNYNDDDTDDFMATDSVYTANEFDTSWVPGNTSNCGYLMQAPFCVGPTRTNAINACNLLTQSVFAACNSLVSPISFINTCTFDYCNCHANHEECFCESLATYASACSRAGLVLSTWREFFCPIIQCPAGSTFQQCGPLCPQTCDSTNDTCYGGCAQGCFCNEEQVVNDLQECVASTHCLEHPASNVSFKQSTYTTFEDDGSVTIVLILSNPSTTDITVQVSTTDGSATGGGVDYDSGPYSVTIPAGNTNVSFDINITIDNLVEDDEEFYLSIDPSSLSSNINTSSPYQTTVNIVNTKTPGVVHFTIRITSTTEVTIIWSPPSLSGGIIIGYQVIYSIYENSTTTMSDVLIRSDESFIISNLVPGIPYQVVVVALTKAGRGAVNNFKPFFSQELIATKEPENLHFTVLSPTSINVTWTPLTLFEARGFPVYKVSLTLSSSHNKRQSISPVITTDSFAVFDNLDSNGLYIVVVGVRTGASNEFMDAEPITGQVAIDGGDGDGNGDDGGGNGDDGGDSVKVIIGVVAGVLVVTVLALSFVIIAVYCVRSQKNKPVYVPEKAQVYCNDEQTAPPVEMLVFQNKDVALKKDEVEQELPTIAVKDSQNT